MQGGPSGQPLGAGPGAVLGRAARHQRKRLPWNLRPRRAGRGSQCSAGRWARSGSLPFAEVRPRPVSKPGAGAPGAGPRAAPASPGPRRGRGGSVEGAAGPGLAAPLCRTARPGAGHRASRALGLAPRKCLPTPSPCELRRKDRASHLDGGPGVLSGSPRVTATCLFTGAQPIPRGGWGPRDHCSPKTKQPWI